MYRRALALVTLLAFLPGCIVGEIRDEIAATNRAIDRVDDKLTHTNTHIDEVQTKMSAVDDANKKLDEALIRLEILQSVQRTLVSIDGTLKKLDEHLASLRKTINNIDSTIPFLKISGDDKDEAAKLEEAKPADGAALPPANNPAAPTAPNPAAPAPPAAPPPAPTPK